MRQFREMNLKKILAENNLKIGEKEKDRIRFIIICILSIVLWYIIFAQGDMVFLERDYYYMQGVGGISHGDGIQENTYSQEFISQYGKIKKIQIDIDKNGIESGGFLKWNIADRKGNVIAGGNIPYEEVEDHRFTEIELNKDVKFLHRYYINISFDKVNNVYPKMIVNHGEEQIRGGKRLFCNGEYLEGMSYVWGIMYGDVILLRHKIPVILFTFVSIVFFLMKDKWKLWMKITIAFMSFFIITEATVYYGECIIDGPGKWFGEATFLSNCKILYLMMAGLLLLTQSPKWTLRVGSIITGILYIADFYVLSFRGSTMKIWDIMSARTAGVVAGNYSYKVSGAILVMLAFLLLVWSISYSFPVLKCKVRYRVLMSAVGIIYCTWLYHDIMLDSFWNKLEGVNCTTAFFQEVDYRRSGYLASFLSQIKESKIKRPENYKREEVESILTAYEPEKAGGKTPHIIVIVNESLADLTVLGGDLPEEPLEFMKSLKENTVRGYINVSVLGGGTSNSEFEFLTGNSMVYLPTGYYPFNRLGEEQESLVWELREMGYETYAMHPSQDTNWNRNTAYPLLGFQNYYWGEDFKDAESRHFGATDRETYKKVIDIFENRKQGEKQFIYDMTIQNHGGYEAIDVDDLIESTYPTVTEYLSLVRYSDRDLEEFIRYFEAQPEEVLICIFGDHQPVLESGFYEEIFSQNGRSEEENLLNQYRAPFWIWTNYDIEEKEDIEISINYLGGLLFETADLPKYTYMQYVSEMREEYPVLTVNGYRDKNGTFCTLEDLPDKLKEYEKVQYYYMYDGGFTDRY